MTDRTALRALVDAGYMPLSEYIACYGDVDADADAALCQRHTQEAVRRSSFTQHTPSGAGSPQITAGAHPAGGRHRMNLGPRHRYRITEKMITAGRRILISFSPDVEDYDDIVAEIFRAMMKAMREGDTE